MSNGPADLPMEHTELGEQDEVFANVEDGKVEGRVGRLCWKLPRLPSTSKQCVSVALGRMLPRWGTPRCSPRYSGQPDSCRVQFLSVKHMQ